MMIYHLRMGIYIFFITFHNFSSFFITLWSFNSSLLKMIIEIVELPTQNGGFSIAMLV